ncbi:MAG: hypothetical protein WDK95_11865 [Syntrophorhabdaceae bacterium]|jgi:hypothetical protein
MHDETQEVVERALTIVEQARAVRVSDNETYIAAGDLWKAIGDMIREVRDAFDPICEAAHKAHKAATAKRAQYLNPLTEAQRSVKSLMAAYDDEQERIRREEERRLAEIARKQEEERRLQEAIAAEQEAKRVGASHESIAQEVEAVLSAPEYVPPVVLPKTTPKIGGGPVYRTVWSAECVDIRALCRAVAGGKASPECVTPNMPTLNKMAAALKDALNIPGVRAVSRRV